MGWTLRCSKMVPIIIQNSKNKYNILKFEKDKIYYKLFYNIFKIQMAEDGPMSMYLSEDIGKESCYLRKTWLKVYTQVFYNIRHFYLIGFIYLFSFVRVHVVTHIL